MKRKLSVTSVVLVFLLLILSVPSPCSESGLEGHWKGAIELPGTTLEVNIDFFLKDGSLAGDISIPVQNAKDLPLANISIQGHGVSFEITGLPGNPAFKGTLSEDGQDIQGDFTQSGQTFPFRLRRENSPAARAREALAGFEEVIKSGLEKLNVPGAAVAIIVEDDVVLAEGFGYRDVEKKIPMTADSLLAIGSASKAFTTFALGSLVDKGQLEWDTPVRRYLPWFRLYDSSASDRITPRDLVTHRSGLPRHDLLWYNNFEASREDLVRRLAYLKPTVDLREKFQYNNLMYLTAGYLLEVLSGEPWEDAVRSLVFQPLGMKRSTFSVDDSQKDEDFALPYREVKGKLERIPFRNITTVGPAGAINSSANEMSRWVKVHLNGGKLDGKSILNPVTVQDMHLAHMPTGSTPSTPEVTPADYGLGWFVDSFRGHRRVHHGGNIDGFSALVSLFPNDRIGFVVLTNMNGTPLPELLVRQAAEILLGTEKKDWIEQAAQNKAKGQEAQQEAEKKKTARRAQGTRPAHKLEEYAGDYTHPGYGDLMVTRSGDTLSFTYNGIMTPLEHWHYETFNAKKAADPTFEDMKLTFKTDVNGRVSGLEAVFEPTLEESLFAKKPDARLFDPEYLKRFVGKYKLVEQTLTVSLKGNALTLYIPGQPEYDLVPGLGKEFTLKQVKVISLYFKEDDRGKAAAIEIMQPQGIFEATRIKEDN